MRNTLVLLYLAHHTHNTDTHRQMVTHRHTCSTTFAFCTFCDMYVCQRYKFCIWHATDIHMHRYTNTFAHICRDYSTYRYRHMHTDICKHTQTYTDTHAYFLHTQTHIHILQINSASLFYI